MHKKNIFTKFIIILWLLVFRYELHVYVLGRPVAFNCCTGHLELIVTKNIDPLCQYIKGPSMQQPAAITIDRNTARVNKQKKYF